MTTAAPRLGAPTTAALSAIALRRARLAVIATFIANGVLFAAWVPRIPEMKDRLDLSAGSLGLALLAPAIGSLVAMNVAGPLSARIGTGPSTRIFAMIFLALGWLPGLAGNYPSLWLLMFAWGLGIGGMDISMNAQAVSVEKAYDRPLMSGFHATYSMGAGVGAGLGTIGAAQHWPIAGQELVIAATLAVILLVIGRYFLADPAPASAPTDSDANVDADPARSADDSTPAPSWWRRGPFRVVDARLVLLGIAALCAMLSEGAVADWSGVLLRDSLHSAAGHVGLGLVAFTITQTIGRLFGDRFVLRLGRSRAIAIIATIGSVGLGAGLATETVAGAIIGFAFLGLGVSFMVPVAFSAAADGQAHAGPAIAVVSTFAYTGFLAGPTAIGFLADAISLSASIWVVPIVTALAGILGVIALRHRGPASTG